jgi:uncharacterized membrane protein
MHKEIEAAMVKIEHSLVIARPIEQVFVFLVNPSNNSLWQEGVIESRQISEGPVGVGTRGRDIREFFGRRIECDYEIVEYEPKERIRFKSISGLTQFDGSYTFQSVQQGTRFTFTIEGNAGPWFSLATPLAARLAKKQVEADSNRLKKLLES